MASRESVLKVTGKLKEIYRGTDRPQVVIVVIPGAATLSPERWDDTHGGNWLWSPQLPFASNHAVFSFSHDLASDETLSWHRVETEGGRLFSQLEELAQSQEFEKCPIVLVAHSLGGILLKRAVCLAYRQQRFPDNIACAILISSPHSQEQVASAWQNIALISKTYPKFRLRENIPSQLAEALAKDCLCFEQAFIWIPVLSVFEEKETKTGRAYWYKSILIDKTTASTNVRHETLVGSKLDHNHTCCISAESETFRKLHSFLESSLRESQRLILERLALYERAHAPEQGTDEGSSTTDSVAGPAHAVSLTQDRATTPSFLTPPTSKGKSEQTAASATSQEAGATLAEDNSTRSDPSLPLFIMPYDRNTGFHGRSSTLEAIAQVLCPPSDPQNVTQTPTGVVSYAVSGPGGIGKTQVAIEFVYSFKHKYDAVFWVSADEVEKMNQTFSRMAISLGLVQEDSVEAKDKIWTRELVLGWLANPLKSFRQREHVQVGEASWLIIFDNVDNPNILDDFWPHNASGSVLITSRDPLAESHFYSSTAGIRLPPFSREETAEFLLKLTQRESDEEDRKTVSDVAEVLGGMPLAIAQMAGVIARREITFAEFLKHYENEHLHEDLFKLRIGSKRADGYEHTIASVWGLDSLKHSGYLLDVLSFLDPDGIPEYILQSNKASTDMDGFPQTIEQYETARTELLQSSLITRDRSAKKLVIHRLIQDTARSRMNEARYSTVFTSALQLISAVWPYEDEFGFMNETYRWAQCNELYSHILCLRKLSKTKKQQPPSDFTPEHLEPPKLFLEAAWFSLMRSDFQDTIALLQMAEYMFKPLQDDEQGKQQQDEEVLEEFEEQLRLFEHHPGTLALHINRPGESLPHLKSFKAMVQEKIRQRPLGQDQRLGVAWNELGNAYLQNQYAKEAEDCFRNSIESLEVLESATTNTVSMPLISLGFALWMQNELEEAAKVFDRALADREAAYGQNDTVSFATGKLCLGYGNVRSDQGRLDESFELHKRCVAQYKATLGPFHHRTADGSVRLSDHYVRLGRYDEASALLESASRTYGNLKHFAPEKARTSYKQWKLFTILNEHKMAAQAGIDAITQFRKTHLKDRRRIEDLTDLDFDRDIMFWSR